MPISMTPRNASEPVQELAGAPLAEILTQLAEAVAEGQARLDLSAASLAESMATTMVSVIPGIRQIIDQDGSTRFEHAPAVQMSLLDLGVQPTFLAFAEATAEVVMDLHITENVSSSDEPKRSSLFAGTRSLRTERKLNRDVTVHSKLTAKLVPVPGPPTLSPTRIVEDHRGEERR